MEASRPQDDFNLAFQALTPDDILTALAELDLDCDGHLLALNSYENRVYQVGLQDGTFVVAKFYRPGRWSEAAIREEHAFSQALAAAGIPVVAPLTIAGESLFRHGRFFFSVAPRRGGRWPELDDSELRRQVGRFVARLHNVGELEAFAHRPEVSIERLGEEARRYLLQSGLVPPELEPAYASTTVHLIDALYEIFDRHADVRVQRLHGDLHPGNLLSRDDALHIVDLDDCLTGPAVQDLWMCLSGEREEQQGQLDDLLEGYAEFRQFDPAELGLIEALRTLRMMHYAAWLARRFADPAFQTAFPWFAEKRYWDEHILSLREQAALLNDPPLSMPRL